jgi:putative alpha-1,2-mannosidase
MGGVEKRRHGVAQQRVEPPTPGGLPGNDDLGAMSAWYVWAALGMFPAVPGEDVLTLDTPLFPAITISVPGREPIRIEAPGAPDAVYIASATLDGEALDRPWVRFADIARGATLAFVTSSEPTDWGAGPGAAPPSLSDG